MIVTVQIDGQKYEVNIGDLKQRPIIAVIGDEQFEVWPEEEAKPVAAPVIAAKAAPSPAKAPVALTPSRQETGGSGLSVIRAPIPGVITAVLVKVGDQIEISDEICKLEAMKMNNSIRSNRAGYVKAVNITVGQQVKHNEVLVEFE